MKPRRRPADGTAPISSSRSLPSAPSIAALETQLRRVGRFDRVIHVDGVSVEHFADEFIRSVGRENLSSEMLARHEALGQLLKYEYPDKRRRQLAVNALKRINWAHHRRINFEDLMFFMANGTADGDFDKASDDANWRTAVHEAGHAAVACLDAPDNSVPVYASNLPGQLHSGVVFPSLESMGTDKSELLVGDIKHRLRVLLGGRVAEHLLLSEDDISVFGADGDLQKVTELAMELVWCKGVPLWPVEPSDWCAHIAVIAEDQLNRRDEKVRETANRVLARLYGEVLDLFSTHKPFLEAIASELHRKRYLLSDDLLSLRAKHSLREV